MQLVHCVRCDVKIIFVLTKCKLVGVAPVERQRKITSLSFDRMPMNLLENQTSRNYWTLKMRIARKKSVDTTLTVVNEYVMHAITMERRFKTKSTSMLKRLKVYTLLLSFINAILLFFFLQIDAGTRCNHTYFPIQFHMLHSHCLTRANLRWWDKTSH